MRIFRWITSNILFAFTLFLLAFIPLYPKLPIVDIKNTWVYIRIEDFLIVFVIGFWITLLVRKKVSFRTPLTIPILIYWIIGALATIHGVLLIFPNLAGVYPNVALLSFLRRIEYLSVFFIAYSAVREKRYLTYTIFVLIGTLLVVCLYGFGQRYFSFPAFLTMNEEFAKGEPIHLSALSRVPSTFAGHYDLAAYLVLIIPILASLLFGFKKLIVRVILAISVILGVVLLFMTVSRVSFVVLFVSLSMMLFFQKKKIAVIAIVILVFLAPVFIMKFTPALLERFGNTVKEVDVLVDAKTGEVIGHASLVPSSHFTDRLIVRRDFQTVSSITSDATIKGDELTKPLVGTFYPLKNVPSKATLVVPPNAPTGEALPQGTAYINLSLSPVVKRLGDFFYENPSDTQASSSPLSFAFHGNFLVKRAAAYDLSFTTRFQGEWPHALIAFSRNIFLGSGYASISLAVDNDYLRLLGETGILGFISFLIIFLSMGIVIRKTFNNIDSPGVKSFVIGFSAGVVGLLFNAFLIDVFEASKVAFVLWLLSGITLGTLALYQDREVNMYKELLRALSSSYAIVAYLFVVTIIVFSPMISNYFVADDYTWFRWAAECSTNNNIPSWCSSTISTITHYFTASDGFFYRPGTKTYFYLMYPFFWLNQNIYHVVSLLLHFFVAVCFFLLAKKILHSKSLGALTGFLFLVSSGYTEIVLWISSTGHLFSALFVLLSVLFFIAWDEKRELWFFVLSLLSLSVSLLFYEAGVVVPLLVFLCLWMKNEKSSLKHLIRIPQFLALLLPIIVYGLMRFLANSHWTGGDYSYNLVKLPFNVIGNLFGYILLTFIGSMSLPFYEVLREVMKSHLPVAFIIAVILFAAMFFVGKAAFRRIERKDLRIILFGLLFFVVTLLPFIGFGNITSRYSYLGSFGLILLFVFAIKKTYLFLLDSGKEIAIGVVAVVLVAFSLLHIIQIQQAHSDWRSAGDKAQRFFISIDSLYADYWSSEPMKFHFINVPVKVGQAWVFPVGLPDAIWFVFRNPNISISTWPSVDAVFQTIPTASTHEKIFEFSGTGDVIERYTLRDSK